jgi:long-chain acyl-CoA synthetase
MIRKGIEAKVASGGAVKSAIFGAAMTLKRWKVPVLAGVAEVILAKVKEAVGGRLRLALSGGSAMAIETQDFLSVALAPVLQGYGLTESCGMCAILPPEKMQYGVAGVPAPAVEIKLLDVPDAGYFSSNDPPQGEIALRGPAVIKGYYKRPDLNADESVFTKDGWFRTGDVGQWNADGTLSIVDRIKNLVKLQNGEYVALERLESVYKSCPLVQTLCVSADAHAAQPLAVICPFEVNLRRALGPAVDASVSFAEICEMRQAREVVLRECHAAARRAGLRNVELLEAVVLTADEWTPETGLVTAAQKIQRKKIASRYEAEIKAVLKQ